MNELLGKGPEGKRKKGGNMDGRMNELAVAPPEKEKGGWESEVPMDCPGAWEWMNWVKHILGGSLG